MTILAQDTFTRSNQSGWGTASDGNTWSHPVGSATLTIASNEGTYTGNAANDNYMMLGSGTQGDTEGLVRFTMSNSSDNPGIVLRYSSGPKGYYAMANGGINLDIWRTGFTRIARTAFFFSANTAYWMRFRVTGSATVTLQVRVWADGASEPASWTASGTDSGASAITTAGQYGLHGFVQTSATDTFDSFQVNDTVSNVTVSRDVSTRFRLVIQSLRDISTRFRLSALSTRDLASRFLLQVRWQRDIGARFPLLATTLRDVAARFKLSVTPLRDLVSRFLLKATGLHDIMTRFRLQVVSPRDIGARFLVQAIQQATIFTRFRLQQMLSRDLATHFGLQSAFIRDIRTRLRLIVTPLRDVASRFFLSALTSRDIVGRFLVQATGVRDLATRLRLQAQVSRDLASRFPLATQLLRDVSGRLRIQAVGVRDLGMRIRLSVTLSHDLPTRLVVGALALRDLRSRFPLVAGAVHHVSDVFGRFCLRLDPSTGIVLFPLPALTLSFAASGQARPVLVPPTLPYAVNGTVLPEQPSVCTAPVETSRILASGSVFTLLFASPSLTTQNLLANGSQVSLRFGLSNGGSATGLVSLGSSLSNGVFQVTCTLLNTLSLSTF